MNYIFFYKKMCIIHNIPTCVVRKQKHLQTICVFPDGSIEELFTDPAKLQELMETVFSTENLVNVLMEMVRKSLDYFLFFMPPCLPPFV